MTIQYSHIKKHNCTWNGNKCNYNIKNSSGNELILLIMYSAYMYDFVDFKIT